MNILLVISSLKFGGAEKQAVIDANLLSEENEVYLVSFNGGQLKEKVNSKVKLHFLEKRNYLLTTIRLAKFIRRNNIEVIHSSLFASMIISGLASIITRVPVIWHFHSHEFDIPLRSRIAFKYLARLKTIKKICFVNKELKLYISKKFKFPEDKLVVLYNSTSFSNSDIASNAKVKLNDVVEIGYIGRLVELKRVEYLIEAARYLITNGINNFHINIVGDGEKRNYLEKLAESLKVDDKIKFWGYQMETEIFYNMFDIFVLPSREECLSIALIDAVVKGIPTIAFNIGGNNEIIHNSINGYLVKSKEEMFELIYRLITNDNLRRSIKNSAIAFSMNKFSQEERKRKLLELHI